MHPYFRWHSLAVAIALTAPVSAQQEVHVHGVAAVDLAIDQDELQIEFTSPADSIVGFEYEPKTDAEKQAIAKAMEMLRDPALLFDLPASANCELHEAEVGREREDHEHGHAEHDDHGHDDHGKDEHAEHDHDHDHDDDHGHDDHGKDEHAEHDDDHGHDEHGHDEDEHEEHAAHDDDHGHDHDHEAEAHSEFHAKYHFDCNGEPIETIGLKMFETWPRIETVRVQALTPGGQTGGNFTADNAVIRLP